MLHLNLQRLEDTAELGRALITRFPGAGLLIVDAELRILLAEGDPHRGWDADVGGRLVRDVIAAAAWDELEPRYREALDGHVQTFDFTAPSRGSVHSVRFAPIRDDRSVIGVMVLSQDITERVTAVRRLADAERLQRALLEVLDEAVVVVDLDGALLQASPSARAIQDSDLETARSDPAAAAVLETGRPLRDVPIEPARPDGTRVSLSVNYQALRGDDGAITGLLMSVRDTSDRDRESERTLRATSNYLRAVADSVGDGVFTLDTEGLLTYMNDAAEQLLGWSREELVGRVMQDVARQGAADPGAWPILNARRDGKAERIDDDVFVRHDGRELLVAYSAAPFETDDGVQGCVVVFTDISERRAYEEELEREAQKLSWIGRIQAALAHDRFLLHAQPIVEVRSGEVVQRELLLRLREPGGEIVAPSEFLQIAEDYGLIGEIDRWVIARGAEIAATGRAVEVNLSAHSIGDAGVLVDIEQCIERSGADPTLLVFEITETALIQDEVAARHFAERLHRLGCKLALDDFGTGYGGFTSLKQLPLDFLKIDIEFVRDLATNPASSHVVQAVVALARGFELQTVAEGVEDAATLELLGELGVDLAQGFHIARPAPLADAMPA